MANMEFAVGVGTTLRDDFDAGTLRRLSNQTRRLLHLALIYYGGKRFEAARIGEVTLQIVRDSLYHSLPDHTPFKLRESCADTPCCTKHQE